MKRRSRARRDLRLPQGSMEQCCKAHQLFFEAAVSRQSVLDELIYAKCVASTLYQLNNAHIRKCSQMIHCSVPSARSRSALGFPHASHFPRAFVLWAGCGASALGLGQNLMVSANQRAVGERLVLLACRSLVAGCEFCGSSWPSDPTTPRLSDHFLETSIIHRVRAFGTSTMGRSAWKARFTPEQLKRMRSQDRQNQQRARECMRNAQIQVDDSVTQLLRTLQEENRQLRHNLHRRRAQVNASYTLSKHV